MPRMQTTQQNEAIMELLNGKDAAQALMKQTAEEIKAIIDQGQRPPRLRVFILGNNPASEAYVGRIVSTCTKLLIDVDVQRLEEQTSEKALLTQIAASNADPMVDGIIVQLPLPAHINGATVTEAIDPLKDVDAFHPSNLGRILLATPRYFPATPYGVIKLLEFYNIETKGKHAVILGRSHIVGLPLANMLIQKEYPGDCTVTVCHSHTQNLHEVLKSADLLFVAIGKPGFIKDDMVKERAVVIDIGINSVAAPESKTGWKIVGDVDFDSVAPKCSYISPVPGGVGPMTNLALARNTLQARLHADSHSNLC